MNKNNYTIITGKVSEHPLFNTWSMMKQRCLNPKHTYYYLYGGRGIKVCDRWLSFENFVQDMGDRPSKNHTLDRYPNKKGNYELMNCRWATIKEQNSNKRKYYTRFRDIPEW